jgi:hypothetical protein
MIDHPLPPLLAQPMARALPNRAWGSSLRLQKQAEYRGEFIAYPARRPAREQFLHRPVLDLTAAPCPDRRALPLATCDESSLANREHSTLFPGATRLAADCALGRI